MALLEKINSPKDIKDFSNEQLNQLAGEVREYLIKVISKTGGHLASNLGVVELTIALHKVFDCPDDSIVWDVGHQSYTHKLLTGRFDRFSTLRQEGGLSGFPRPSESKYDAFISGHSSTSISVACGIAKANTLDGKDDNFTVAIIGDGAFTGGMAYEALNNAGRSGDNLIVVLNHNEMSISKNVGAFARYLSNIRLKKGYINLKQNVEKVLNKLPLVGQPIKRAILDSKSTFKNIFLHDNFFEDLGFKYFGPVNGHNIEELTNAFARAKEIKGPVFIQVETIKGKGYSHAEENPGAYHGISKFDVETGNPDVAGKNNFSSVFGSELLELAKADERICAVTAAMADGTGLNAFKEKYPDRFFDVGIAEAHAVTFTSALASKGKLPVFAVYSSFLQRAYDQLVHDTAIDNQHIVLGIDRAGVVGEDGETHQGLFDFAFLSTIPNTTIFAPTTFAELKAMLKKAIYDTQGIVAVRYPRGSEKSTLDLNEFPPDADFVYKKANSDTLVISYGRIFSDVFSANEALGNKKHSVLKLNKIHSIPSEVLDIARNYKNIVFFEENMKANGVAEKMLLELAKQGFNANFDIIALKEPFIMHASTNSVLAKNGLDSESIFNKLNEYIGE